MEKISIQIYKENKRKFVVKNLETLLRENKLYLNFTSDDMKTIYTDLIETIISILLNNGLVENVDFKVDYNHLSFSTQFETTHSIIIINDYKLLMIKNKLRLSDL